VSPVVISVYREACAPDESLGEWFDNNEPEIGFVELILRERVRQAKDCAPKSVLVEGKVKKMQPPAPGFILGVFLPETPDVVASVVFEEMAIGVRMFYYNRLRVKMLEILFEVISMKLSIYGRWRRSCATREQLTQAFDRVRIDAERPVVSSR